MTNRHNLKKKRGTLACPLNLVVAVRAEPLILTDVVGGPNPKVQQGRIVKAETFGSLLTF